MLHVKKLSENAIVPTVQHAGEDLGYDLYASEHAMLEKGRPVKVRTGIAARFLNDHYQPMTGFNNYGLLIRDRSSMASKGLTVSGGVVDAGYTGEIVVILTNQLTETVHIQPGEKIAQMIPIKVETTYGAIEVPELPESSREEKGFGSSGK